MRGNNVNDVIIIGGSYAGLSAALTLGRSLRQTLIIDSNTPCNQQTPHSHNFLTQDGKTPKEISALAKQQVRQYKTVHWYEGLAVSGKKVDNLFEVNTRKGDIFYCKKMILATGINDEMPDIKGFSDCWGISVIHCPYCHGFEYHSQKTGIMANGDVAFHMASLVNNLTNGITILTNGKSEFTTEQLTRLTKHQIQVVEDKISEIEHEKGYIKHVILSNGGKLPMNALYASIPFSQHSDISVNMGCELTESGYIKVDDFQQTTVEGVFACGDNSSPFRSVANAVATGNFSGAFVNKILIDEQF